MVSLFRFMPEPNLPPLRLRDSAASSAKASSSPNALDVAPPRSSMPELPWARRRRLTEEAGLSADAAERLVVMGAEEKGQADRAMSDFFEECFKLAPKFNGPTYAQPFFLTRHKPLENVNILLRVKAMPPGCTFWLR